jgi:hypothetical protein
VTHAAITKTLSKNTIHLWRVSVTRAAITKTLQKKTIHFWRASATRAAITKTLQKRQSIFGARLRRVPGNINSSDN